MKYILKKKWHPSQVEEIGHVFEEEATRIYYSTTFDTSRTFHTHCEPHEITLLCDAGYLEKQKERHEYVAGAEIRENEAIVVKSDGKVYPADPQLELWTELPPKGETYEFVTHYGDIDWAVSQENDWDKFRLKTKNCHKTYKSAEEALKQIKSKYEIE